MLNRRISKILFTLPADITIVYPHCIAVTVRLQCIVVTGSRVCRALFEKNNNDFEEVWKKSWILHGKMCMNPVLYFADNSKFLHGLSAELQMRVKHLAR